MNPETIMLLLLAANVVVAVGGSIFFHYLNRQAEADHKELSLLMEAHAADMVEFLGHVRRTMEDLVSRDPQIADTVELGLVDLGRQEKAFRLLAAGDYRGLKKMYHGDN